MRIDAREPLRILHNIYSVGPASFGLGPVALNLAKEQLRLGHDALVWCVDNVEDCLWAATSSGLPADKIRRFPTTGPRKFYFSLQMAHASVQEAGEISIVHHHALWTGLSLVTNRLHKRERVPTVIAPHGMLEKWALRKSRLKKSLALALYERKTLFGASCLHACSEQEMAGFREFGLQNPVAVIPNGISNSWLKSSGDGNAFRKRFGLPPDKRIMLFLSRITPVKGLTLLLDALDKVRPYLDNWLVVIAGADEFDHKAEISEKITRLHLEDSIVFTGLLVDQVKRDAFAAAEIFVLPTRKENYGIVIAEALGAGVPVLTTKGAPWENLVAAGCGWWVDIDCDAISEALKLAINLSSDELRMMGTRGKELVATHHTWFRSAQLTIELYEWLLGRGKKPDFVFFG